MSTSWHKYELVDGSDDPEDIPLVAVNEKPVCRICKCHPSVLAELGEKGKLQVSHPRFGPFYREDESEVSGKKEAWDKVLEKSGGRNRNRTIENYLFATRRVEKRARASYADAGGVVRNLTESQFRWMMIEDGCFFLQLALFILGASSEQLGYPGNHIIFGNKKKKEDVNRWIEAMFFVGNQIPLVVLNEFMKQSFFQDILKVVNWETPSQLPKRILYELLVLPAREHVANQTVASPKPRGEEQQPTDLLHALHSFMLDPGRSLSNVNLVDADTGDVDLGDSRGVHGAKDLTLSASELNKKGIRFRKVKKVGCTEISFTDYFIFARLYLPVFTVGDDTELVFKSLKHYEESQQQGKSKREVRSYLQFMNDLICTYEDVKLLAKKGIIKADNPYHKEKLPTILSNLAGQDKHTTPNLHLLRIQLRDYNIAPWERFKLLAILLFILTLIQTVFAVLAYFRPPRQYQN
ncbi:uncharacterized protein LOC113765857 [Coffea eugenioides]|uniref:uncharacterized protein LOC113765857 n=1 Tax=Coffea eugenioides TaxID=49369 RepID=UPI000F60D252|nr:uncharacterized protein LOC113765857 [Coffea eugenioides]